MVSKNMSDCPVGVIGAGSFGLAITNILAENSQVLLYARRQEVVNQINNTRSYHGHEMHPNVLATNDMKSLAERCRVIFPIVPSANFRDMIKSLAPYLFPYHILIHGTKGLDASADFFKDIDNDSVILTRDHVHTMSEIITEETVVVRVGCLSGPNLSKELAAKQPSGTVVASHFNEVINEGQRLLKSDRFQVYGNNDIIGIELAGVLKNILAIASGALNGLGYGDNARGMLISRGLVELIYVGKMLGGNTESFIGLAGIGDIVATCSSKLSRNYTVGYRLAQGESIDQVMGSINEVAEGVKTVKIVKKLADHYGVRAPITESIYKVLYQGMTVPEALSLLMKLPLNIDIDFL